jgi:hypothetical protein
MYKTLIAIYNMSNTHKHKAKGKFNNGLLEEPDNTYERMADR